MENLFELGDHPSVSEKPYSDSDERIFTVNDVKRLYIRQKRKIFRAAVAGAAIAFCLFLLKAPKYKIEATFKEGAEKSGGDNPLKEMLGVSGFSSQPQAVVAMRSLQVVKPLVEELGLNAQIQNRGGILSKLYRRIRDNIAAEMGRPIVDLDPFSFRAVSYDGEGQLFYWIRFESGARYSVLDGEKNLLATGNLGEEIRLADVSFTLVKAPKNLILDRNYPLSISSSTSVARGMRDQIQIAPDRANKSIYNLTVSHRDRRLGVSLLNQLMREYQRYLKREHDEVATEQLAYLQSRQDQIFQNLGSVFGEHEKYLEKNLEENGLFGVKTESSATLAPLHQMGAKVTSIEVELLRLDQWEREGRLPAPADEGPFSRRLLEIASEVQELKQQRDLLELSLHQRQSIDENGFETRRSELSEVRRRGQNAKELLSAFEKGKEIPEPSSFDAERALSSWAERLRGSREEEREDFAEYLDNHIRLLSVQEKMLHERLFFGSAAQSELEGIDLATAKDLFVQYNGKLDQSQASMRHFAKLKGEIDQKDFEIGSLSSVLSDPLSQSLIASANQVSVQLKDEKYHSEKEGERWGEELALQRKILKDHLEQLFNVEELNAALIREKIVGLQQASLDCIHRKISVLTEQASDAMKERREALLQEKTVLERKIEEMRLRASRSFPEKWSQERWLDLKTEMGGKMMAALTELVESKTIGHHLHHVESKPLDLATLPGLPQKPGLFAKAFLGAFAAGFGFFFLVLLQSIFRGFPSSVEKLRAMRYPVLGELDSFCDGPDVGETTGPQLELLRQISLFLESRPGAKTVALLAGNGPDYSYALAENLARRSVKSIVLRCDFLAKFRKEDKPGLLQVWKGEASELPIRKMKGYDLITAGGFTPYGIEAIQSAPFQQLLEMLKKTYPLVILLFRSPLELAESKAALRISDKAVATVTGEPTELLTPFADWAYHEGHVRLAFVVANS